MELHNLFNFICEVLPDGCKKSFAHNSFEIAVYLAFCFFNTVRVFTYVPMIKKLLQPGCTGDGQSLFTWITWICANTTLGLHLYVVAGYRMNELVWLSAGNVIMCSICALLVFKVQKRSALVQSYLDKISARAAANGPAQPTY